MFEKLLPPIATPERSEPPAGLVAFYWHFAKQAKPLFFGLFAIGLVVALLDIAIPVFIGKVVDLVSHGNSDDLLANSRPMLAGMAGVLLWHQFDAGHRLLRHEHQGHAVPGDGWRHLDAMCVALARGTHKWATSRTERPPLRRAAEHS